MGGVGELCLLGGVGKRKINGFVGCVVYCIIKSNMSELSSFRRNQYLEGIRGASSRIVKSQNDIYTYIYYII